MDKDEILRLKQITGLTSLFRDVDFSRAWIPGESWDYGEDPDWAEAEELLEDTEETADS